MPAPVGRARRVRRVEEPMGLGRVYNPRSQTLPLGGSLRRLDIQSVESVRPTATPMTARVLPSGFFVAPAIATHVAIAFFAA
jgi:hypothetical protein